MSNLGSISINILQFRNLQSTIHQTLATFERIYLVVMRHSLNSLMKKKLCWISCDGHWAIIPIIFCTVKAGPKKRVFPGAYYSSVTGHRELLAFLNPFYLKCMPGGLWLSVIGRPTTLPNRRFFQRVHLNPHRSTWSSMNHPRSYALRRIDKQ